MLVIAALWHLPGVVGQRVLRLRLRPGRRVALAYWMTRKASTVTFGIRALSEHLFLSPNKLVS